MSTLQNRIAGEVRALVARDGGNAMTLANLLGVSAPTARKRWEGSTPYRVDELEQIATHFDTSVSSLIEAAVPTAA